MWALDGDGAWESAAKPGLQRYIFVDLISLVNLEKGVSEAGQHGISGGR